jgi:hypothetical protein
MLHGKKNEFETKNLDDFAPNERGYNSNLQKEL